MMENDRLRVTVASNAEITSYVLKESGREFARTPMNHFRLFKDVPRNSTPGISIPIMRNRKSGVPSMYT